VKEAKVKNPRRPIGNGKGARSICRERVALGYRFRGGGIMKGKGFVGRSG